MYGMTLPSLTDPSRVERTRIAARHLAMACRTLALLSAGDGPAAARLKAAEARFRSLADADPATLAPALAASPNVATGRPDPVPLVDLLDAVSVSGPILPSRSVDPDLVDIACHLLRDYAWHVPAA